MSRGKGAAGGHSGRPRASRLVLVGGPEICVLIQIMLSIHLGVPPTSLGCLVWMACVRTEVIPRTLLGHGIRIFHTFPGVCVYECLGTVLTTQTTTAELSGSRKTKPLGIGVGQTRRLDRAKEVEF